MSLLPTEHAAALGIFENGFQRVTQHPKSAEQQKAGYGLQSANRRQPNRPSKEAPGRGAFDARGRLNGRRYR
jgi:hypothetical protein